jgi:hypothetical protein
MIDGTSIAPGTAWVIGAIGASLITAGPAYLAARKSRGTAREEGELTRDAVTSAIGELNGRIDQLHDGLRADIAEVRDWQAAHTTEHAVSVFQQTNPHPRLERRDQETR